MIEILTGVLCFLNIVDTVFKVKDKLHNKAEKEGASHFLAKIGDLLNSVADDLQNGVYPHDKCSEMWSYLKGFQSIMESKIGVAECTILQDEIGNAYQVEKLLGELNGLSPGDRQKNIAAIKSAAGSFHAASLIIKL